MHKNYPELRAVFEAFVFEKTGRFQHIAKVQAFLQQFQEYNPQSAQSLETLLGQNIQTVYQQFIAPWRALSKEQAIAVAYLWSQSMMIEHNLTMELEVIQDYKALFWTMVNVYELKLFELFTDTLEAEKNRPIEEWDWITHLFVAPEYSLPYKQCRYCGCLNQDPRGKVFGKLNYCHLATCDSADRNASGHPEGCCFIAWDRHRKNLRDRIQRHHTEPEKVKALFLEFCEARYKANQMIQVQIQVEKHKPKGWESVVDQSAVKVYLET